MILSASRRTDIPAFYSDWFFNRLTAGYVLIPQPYNPKRLSRVNLSTENVDCIVFWTKNPAPMLEKFARLDALGYNYCVQFTLTPYDRQIEPGLPPKSELISTFQKMAALIGPTRCLWRYDPIFIDHRHSVAWHLAAFERLCAALTDSTERCILSFIDLYRGLEKYFRTVTAAEMQKLAAGFAPAAKAAGIRLTTCAEAIDLTPYGIEHGACIDKQLMETIIGGPLLTRPDPHQRPACRCLKSVDIGVYDTCAHGCTYCYATGTGRRQLPASAVAQPLAQDPHAPMLTGYPTGSEIITDRTEGSDKDPQLSLF